jgi:hypothetical protein
MRHIEVLTHALPQRNNYKDCAARNTTSLVVIVIIINQCGKPFNKIGLITHSSRVVEQLDFFSKQQDRFFFISTDSERNLRLVLPCPTKDCQQALH